MIGRVVSTKSKNTATVLVERTARHPLYKKSYIQSKKFLVDDPIGVKDGDIVEAVKVRPISKNKHFKIVKVLGKDIAEIAKEEMAQKAKEVISEVMPEPSSAEASEGKKKEVVMDNSAEKTKSKKKGRTELSKQNGTA